MTSKTSNLTDTIKAVFTNLIFVIGIILTVIGFIRGTSTAVKLAVFGEYPLNSYEETRCEINKLPQRYPTLDTNTFRAEDPVDLDKINKDCEESLERERKLKLVEDVTGSFSFFVAGIVLSFSFRKFIFDKK